MKDFLLILLHLAVMTAKLCGPGGVRAVIAENLVLKQQLIVLRRGHRRAPSLTLSDGLLCGFGSLFLSPGRIRSPVVVFRVQIVVNLGRADREFGLAIGSPVEIVLNKNWRPWQTVAAWPLRR